MTDVRCKRWKGSNMVKIEIFVFAEYCAEYTTPVKKKVIFVNEYGAIWCQR